MVKKTPKITVALAVYNESANLARCLESVHGLTEDIIVVDGGSADATREIAGQFGATVIQSDNPPMFHTNKQKALDHAHGDWILQLDADEVVSPELKREILTVTADRDAHDGYYIPRKNYFLGRWLKKGGQYPDRVIRLFRRGKGSFPQKSVHEQISIDGSVGTLTQPLDHYSYISVAQYWKKSDSYIRLTASEVRGKHTSAGAFLSYTVIRPVTTFLALYVRHKGFMDGWQGFLFALFSAMHFPKAYWRSFHL